MRLKARKRFESKAVKHVWLPKAPYIVEVAEDFAVGLMDGEQDTQLSC